MNCQMQCELVFFFFFDKTVPFMSRISRYYLVKLFYDLASKIVICVFSSDSIARIILDFE